MDSVAGLSFLNLTLDSLTSVEPDTHVSDTNNWLLAVALLVGFILISLLVIGFRLLLKKRSSTVQSQEDVERPKSSTNQKNGSGMNNTSTGSQI
ncbi:hypothetical protein GCK32_013964 [Trichostrongylus colubriformis]|uniref:Uncharacterized protein n=1 Tax=Trichostrongylus colubriformis TaxID=6319 RepID=A0AAN8FBS1_TRICO